MILGVNSTFTRQLNNKRKIQTFLKDKIPKKMYFDKTIWRKVTELWMVFLNFNLITVPSWWHKEQIFIGKNFL